MTAQPQADVRLVLTVDLSGPFHNSREVSNALREQTKRNVDCHTVIVRLGADAVRHNLELARSIAAVFFLSAERIEVHAPAGNVMGAIIHDEVARHVRLFTADHAQRTASTPATPTG
ncbi:hypothetical protein [Streptomyces phaeochromogenes]|uniref:hypothetical protein n=1 Tax=Streptomyces phaeochromogenes TaxID=1923 RepID=UPI002DDB3ABB|nr:hypothetical protein [Streptomyces phaeochromogenes]WRZ31364.1 hypothetical protein OG931_28270 [Streptomyces phaeochromogenes]